MSTRDLDVSDPTSIQLETLHRMDRNNELLEHLVSAINHFKTLTYVVIDKLDIITNAIEHGGSSSKPHNPGVGCDTNPNLPGCSRAFNSKDVAE